MIKGLGTVLHVHGIVARKPKDVPYEYRIKGLGTVKIAR